MARYNYPSGRSTPVGTFGGSTSGSGTPYGTVPGQMDVPPSLYEQLGKTGVTSLTPAATSYVQSEIAGQLTPAEKAALQDQAAAWAVQSGMPMTSGLGIGANKWDTSRLLATMNREAQGLRDYQGLVQSLAPTMNRPELLADIQNTNLERLAAPDPALAVQAALNEWMTKFNLMQQAQYSSPAGGTGKRRVGISYGGGGGEPSWSTGKNVFKPNTWAADQMGTVIGRPTAAQETYDPYASWYKNTFGGQGAGSYDTSSGGRGYTYISPTTTSPYGYESGTPSGSRGYTYISPTAASPSGYESGAMPWEYEDPNAWMDYFIE